MLPAPCTRQTAFGSPQVEQPEPPASSSATPLVNPSKQLDFGVSGGTPSTPEMTAAFGHAGLGSSDEVRGNGMRWSLTCWPGVAATVTLLRVAPNLRPLRTFLQMQRPHSHCPARGFPVHRSMHQHATKYTAIA